MDRLIVASNRVIPPSDAGVGTAGALSMQVVGGLTVALMDLEEQDREEYSSYANRTLWPLFHLADYGEDAGA